MAGIAVALLDLDRRPGRRRVGAARGPRGGRGGLHRRLGDGEKNQRNRGGFTLWLWLT